MDIKLYIHIYIYVYMDIWIWILNFQDCDGIFQCHDGRSCDNLDSFFSML
jgi:hypothetical protein